MVSPDRPRQHQAGEVGNAPENSILGNLAIAVVGHF